MPLGPCTPPHPPDPQGQARSTSHPSSELQPDPSSFNVCRAAGARQAATGLGDATAGFLEEGDPSERLTAMQEPATGSLRRASWGTVGPRSREVRDRVPVGLSTEGP